MLHPKTNVCKLRNGVLLVLFACFQDGRQNHTVSYIVVDSLFNVPRNICGCSLLVVFLLCISSCSFYFCQHLDEEENDSCFALIVFLMSCGCKCSVALPHHAVDLSSVVSVVFPVYTHLLLAYLVFSFYNEWFIHSTILN